MPDVNEQLEEYRERWGENARERGALLVEDAEAMGALTQKMIGAFKRGEGVTLDAREMGAVCGVMLVAAKLAGEAVPPEVRAAVSATRRKS